MWKEFKGRTRAKRHGCGDVSKLPKLSKIAPVVAKPLVFTLSFYKLINPTKGTPKATPCLAVPDNN